MPNLPAVPAIALMMAGCHQSVDVLVVDAHVDPQCCYPAAARLRSCGIGFVDGAGTFFTQPELFRGEDAVIQVQYDVQAVASELAALVGPSSEGPLAVDAVYDDTVGLYELTMDSEGLPEAEFRYSVLDSYSDVSVDVVETHSSPRLIEDVPVVRRRSICE